MIGATLDLWELFASSELKLAQSFFVTSLIFSLSFLVSPFFPTLHCHDRKGRAVGKKKRSLDKLEENGIGEQQRTMGRQM